MREGFSAEERVLLRGLQLPAPASLRNWYPVAARQGELWWRFFGDRKFSEPFFHDTVCALPERHWTRTSFEALEQFEDSLAPSAFIFHGSRCGSTLLTQLLTSLPGCVAMSEPPVIESFLRLHHAGAVLAGADQLLGRLVCALGQKRFPDDRHFFIKLDCWHIGSLQLFRRAFPQTPFLFLYRKPDEVLASHYRRRGRQMVPGLVDIAPLEPDTAGIAPGDLDGYCIKVLEQIYGAACRHGNDLILINYRQLPHIAWTELLDMFSLDCSTDQVAAMQARGALHSKTSERFAGDPQPEDGAAEDLCRSVQSHYEMLERLRCGQAHFGQ